MVEIHDGSLNCGEEGQPVTADANDYGEFQLDYSGSSAVVNRFLVQNFDSGSAGNLTVDVFGGTLNTLTTEAGDITSLYVSSSQVDILGPLLLDQLTVASGTFVATGTLTCNTTSGSLDVSGGLMKLTSGGTVYGLTVSSSGNLQVLDGPLCLTDLELSGNGLVNLSAPITSRAAGSAPLVNVLGTSQLLVGSTSVTGAVINISTSGLVSLTTGSINATTSLGQINVSGAGLLSVSAGFVNANTLTLSSATGSLQTLATVTSGTIAAQLFSMSGTAGLSLGSGYLTASQINVNDAALLNVGTGFLNASTLSLSSTLGTTQTLVKVTTGTITAQQLNISGTAALDLGTGSLTVAYGSGTGPDSTIQSYIASGRNSGNWNGVGINSSAVAAITSDTTYYAVGYADGADDMVSGLSPGQIKVVPTLAGDARLEGKVGFDDFQIVLANYGQPGNWDQGNFMYTSTVDFADFQLVLQNYGKTSTLGGASPGVRSGPGPGFGEGRHLDTPDAATVTLNITASDGDWTVYADAAQATTPAWRASTSTLPAVVA